jgi:hypothetical protein
MPITKEVLAVICDNLSFQLKNTVINCKTKEEALSLLTMAHEHGFRWVDEAHVCLQVFGDTTCYHFDEFGFIREGTVGQYRGLKYKGKLFTYAELTRGQDYERN